MSFEPILLKAPLTTILNWLTLAFRTRIKWYKLLVKFCLLSFEKFFKRAQIVFTLADVDYSIVRRLWDLTIHIVKLITCLWLILTIFQMHGFFVRQTVGFVGTGSSVWAISCLIIVTGARIKRRATIELSIIIFLPSFILHICLFMKLF